jgi:3-carboxy-cis,cis-muconate cycloisomerase
MAVPEMFIASAGALHQARFMLEGLIVEPEAMRRNLDLTGGLIVAEAVMMALAPHTGRGPAHDLVYAACRASLEEKTTLIEQLQRMPDITRHFDSEALARLIDPANYLGTAGEMVDRVLSKRS